MNRNFQLECFEPYSIYLAAVLVDSPQTLLLVQYICLCTCKSQCLCSNLCSSASQFLNPPIILLSDGYSILPNKPYTNAHRRLVSYLKILEIETIVLHFMFIIIMLKLLHFVYMYDISSWFMIEDIII